MTTADDVEERVLRSYRRARTYPKTIRKLANLDLPYPVTVPQLATWVALFAALWYSRPVWIGIAGPVQVGVLVVVPTAAAIMLRHLRLEGRSPTAMAAGLFALLCAPPTGVVHGRPVRRPQPVRYRAVLVFWEPGSAEVAEAVPYRSGPPRQQPIPGEAAWAGLEPSSEVTAGESARWQGAQR